MFSVYKTEAIYSFCPLYVVVVVVVINSSHFHLFLHNHWANINQTWQITSLGKEFQVRLNERLLIETIYSLLAHLR